jgi:hypothetical protein
MRFDKAICSSSDMLAIGLWLHGPTWASFTGSNWDSVWPGWAASSSCWPDRRCRGRPRYDHKSRRIPTLDSPRWRWAGSQRQWETKLDADHLWPRHPPPRPPCYIKTMTFERACWMVRGPTSSVQNRSGWC